MKHHPEALVPNQLPILEASAVTTDRWEAYLAGGMAAAIQMGHRVSADFDWFTKRTIAPGTILADIKSMGFPITVQQNDEGTFLGQVGKIDYSVFRYRYDVVGRTTSFAGCNLASLADIGAMKMAAVCSRAKKRDYVDVYCMITRGGKTLDELVRTWTAKYPGKDPGFALKGLVYFKDVENDRMPEMIWKVTWPVVKKGLQRAVDQYMSR